jgi:hypothetical protein
MLANVVLPFLTIVAIIVGPIAALYIQRKLDRERAAKDRKLHIFRTLMTYRASRLAAPFVEALNAIELEFYSEDGSKRKVIEAWREYMDHLYDPGWHSQDSGKLIELNNKAVELTSILLSEMGDHLGYHFEKGVLRKNIYHPQGWTDRETDQAALLRTAVEVFGGNKPLRVKIEEDADRPTPMPLSLPLSEQAPPSGHPAAQGALGRAAARIRGG